MQKSQQTDEFYDVYYDVSETLFDRIRETMNRQTNLDDLKMIRDYVVRIVTLMENTDATSIYRDLEDVRAGRGNDRSRSIKEIGNGALYCKMEQSGFLGKAIIIPLAPPGRGESQMTLRKGLLTV